jgi:hypothetical protein
MNDPGEIAHASLRGAVAAMAMTGIAPALGLRQLRQMRLTERAALAGDHLLYGFVLSETRRRPRE